MRFQQSRPAGSSGSPSSWDEIDAIADEPDEVSRPIRDLPRGACARPEEAFRAEWPDVDLERRVFMVRRGFAKCRLKDYGKTIRSRRVVPLRARVVAALERLPHRREILFQSPAGSRIDINNGRSRSWTPSLAAAGIASADLRPAPHVRV